MNFRNELLSRVSIAELEEWLKRNPPPKSWNGDKYSWAYTEMTVGKFHSWFRKNILGYNL